MDEIFLSLEEKLKLAKSITFFPTEDYQKGPSVILVLFNTIMEANSAQDSIKEIEDNFALLFSTKDDKLSLSIILKSSSEILDFSLLFYNKENFNDFIQKESGNRKIAFGFGFIENMHPTFALRAGESPIMIHDFKVS